MRLLAERLREAGLEVVETREPNGPIRDLLVNGEPDTWQPKTEALLHFAARAEHLERTVLPAIEAGKWVVCDRFADSTMAYQGIGQGLGAAFIDRLYDLVVGDFKPDLTLILDLPVAVGLARAADRATDGEDRYERMGAAFHENLRGAFHDIAERNPERCILVDASGSAEDVGDAIWQAVAGRLKLA